MSMESDFLLGISYGLLMQVRAHLIRKEDIEGMTLIEDEFQSLTENIDKVFYSNGMEKKNDKRK